MKRTIIISTVTTHSDTGHLNDRWSYDNAFSTVTKPIHQTHVFLGKIWTTKHPKSAKEPLRLYAKEALKTKDDMITTLSSLVTSDVAIMTALGLQCRQTPKTWSYSRKLCQRMRSDIFQHSICVVCNCLHVELYCTFCISQPQQQSSAVITRSNLSRYYPQHCYNSSKTERQSNSQQRPHTPSRAS